MLLVGGLVEGKIPQELVNDLESMHPQRLGNGAILSRSLTSPDNDVVMAQLADESMKALIAPHLQSAAAIRLRVAFTTAAPARLAGKPHNDAET